MPYIITTRERYSAYVDSSAPYGRLLSRRAVATLDEAREAAAETVRDHRPAKYWDGIWHTLAERATLLPESGGTIGPLPDGTVIEVERVSMYDLLKTIRFNRAAEPWPVDETVIAAYNEAQK